MTIQDVGAIGELIAAVATVATLIYLAVQIRQNTATNRSNSAASQNQADLAIMILLAQDADASHIFFEGLSGNAALSDAACATPYFNTVFNTCDWRDGRGEPFGRDWAGTPGTEQFYEQLFVRTVPEPSTFLLLTFGLICLTARRRTH